MRFGEDIDFSIRIFKAGSVADCSLRHGFGTSVVRTSASSGSRFTILVSPESTSIRSTLSR